MKQSESILTLAKSLPKAQAAIATAKKDVNNTFFNTKYADLASIIDACKPGLNANGFTFLQPVTSSERGVVIETILLHESGEWISECLEVPVSKQDAQGVGSAITYGRRYGLQALIGVPAEDDDGNAATSPRATTPAQATGDVPKRLTERQVADFMASIDGAHGLEEKKRATKTALTTANDMGDIQAYESIKAHAAKVAKQELATQA